MWKQLDIRPDYEISINGELRRKKRAKKYKGEYSYINGMDNGRYLQVMIRSNPKQKEYKVYTIHRLVAEAFIPNIENKPCVNHKDGNTYNNCVSNLEWVTHSENTIHAIEVLGTHHGGADWSGNKNPKYKHGKKIIR